MSATLVLEQRLEEVIGDLPLDLGSIYTLKSRHRTGPRPWTWLVKRGKFLFVDLLAAAAFYEAERRPLVAEKLRARAVDRLKKTKQQEGIAAALAVAAAHLQQQ